MFLRSLGFGRLTLRQQMLGLLVVTLVLLAALLAWQATSSWSYQRSYANVHIDNLRLRLSLRRLQDFYGYGMAKWSQGVAQGAIPAEQALSQLRTQRDWAHKAWDDVIRSSTDTHYGARLQSILALRPEVDQSLGRLEQALAAEDRAALQFFFVLRGDPARWQLMESLSAVVNDMLQTEPADLEQGRQELLPRQLALFAGSFVSVLALFALFSLGLRGIYRAIDQFAARARRITARDFAAAHFDNIPPGELGELAQAFTTMQQALADYEAELRDRELEARAANQAKSVFLAAMSHEIRTPLIGVLGMLEVLGHSKLDPEQRHQFNIVEQSARSLLEVIGDVLDYSKIEAGKMALAPEPLSVRDLVSRVVANFSATAESKGLRLVQQVDAAVAAAHVGDRVRLMQILRNLISNAIKFTERGQVTMTVAVLGSGAPGQRLAFRVADTGIGMTAEQLSRLFQPFTQADVGTARQFGGTGLGLVICQRLAALMQGTLRMDSTPGQGTLVTLEVELPVSDPKAVVAAAGGEVPLAATRPRPTREQAQREGSLLLLAEDHPVNRLVLTQQLDMAGFVVDVAENGAVALEKYRGGGYGLVLTDLHMPGLDGFQLTRAIRDGERAAGARRTPIIALTADVRREALERCLTEGMDDYVVKPATIHELVQKLRRWLPQVYWQAAAPDAPAAAPPAATPFDPRALDALGGLDAAGRLALLRRYGESATDDLAALDEALRSGGNAAEVAHRIKGAAMTVGAHEVAAVAARIERQRRESATADVAGLVGELKQAVARADAYVRDVMGAAAPKEA